MRKDTLASGGFKASYGPISVSKEKWASIFGPADSPTQAEPSTQINRPSKRTVIKRRSSLGKGK